MVDYARDPTPHDNFGGGSATWVVWADTWLVTSQSFVSFVFLFLLSSARTQVAFLDRSGRSIIQNACFRPRVCLLGSWQYLTSFRGSNPQKTSTKWAGMGISQPNWRSSKIAIYQSSMKIFTSNFTDRFTTGAILEKNAKLGKRGPWLGHVTYC